MAIVAGRHFVRGADGVWYQVVPGRELRRVANALREIDVGLPTKFRKDLREAAKPMVVAAKAAARAIPVTNPDRRALRRKIARGVAIQAATGRSARVRIVTKMPDVKEAIIPRGMDSSKGFRHPVFGRDQWVTQKPQTASRWFMDAMQNGQPEALARIKATVDEAAAYVASRGGRI
jgi:hypothetical protein